MHPIRHQPDARQTIPASANPPAHPSSTSHRPSVHSLSLPQLPQIVQFPPLLPDPPRTRLPFLPAPSAKPAPVPFKPPVDEPAAPENHPIGQVTNTPQQQFRPNPCFALQPRPRPLTQTLPHHPSLLINPRSARNPQQPPVLNTQHKKEVCLLLPFFRAHKKEVCLLLPFFRAQS